MRRQIIGVSLGVLGAAAPGGAHAQPPAPPEAATPSAESADGRSQPFAVNLTHPSSSSARLMTALTAEAASSPAASERSSFAKIFVAGPSAGEPSTAKLFTIYSFYSLALGSLAVGGVAYFAHLDSKQEADDFIEDHGTPGPCYSLTSLPCQELERLRDDQRRNLTLASVGIGASGFFLLSGVFTAQQWGNVRTSVATSSDGARFDLRFAF